MHPMPQETGWIEVICGPMFSGKTEELIRRLVRAQIARQQVQIFKPAVDVRYHARHVVSHSRRAIESVPVSHADEILAGWSDAQVVGVDEAQFFGAELVEVCEALADRGVRVIAAGLDQDYRGVPFEPMPGLLAVAEYVTKQLAICVVCGNPAGRSQRLVGERRRVMVGASDSYEARCRRCFDPSGAHPTADAVRPQQLDLGAPDAGPTGG